MRLFDKITKTIWEPFQSGDPLDSILLGAGYVILAVIIIVSLTGG